MTPYRSEITDVLGTQMHHLEAGAGRAVLLLHGNPTSSFLWRHVLERACRDDRGHRWIAPDLIGMGASGKPASDYKLSDHIAHVDGLVAALGLSEVVLVGHDWGVAIAQDLLRRGVVDVHGVAVMEAHLGPLPGWDALDEGGRSLFQQLRQPDVGEQMVLHDNFFIDTLLPAGLTVDLSDEEIEVYRTPYPDPASRRPLLQWAREIPVDGKPAESAATMAAAAEYMAASDVPKLILVGDPGVLVTPQVLDRCMSTWSNLTVAKVGGPAGHFLPEDRPTQVADALLDWVAQL